MTVCTDCARSTSGHCPMHGTSLVNQSAPSTWESEAKRITDLQTQLAETALTVTRLEADLKISYEREDYKRKRAEKAEAEITELEGSVRYTATALDNAVTRAIAAEAERDFLRAEIEATKVEYFAKGQQSNQQQASNQAALAPNKEGK